MSEAAKKHDLPGIALAACGVVLAAGVMTAFRACGPAEDGSWMHCHDVQLYLAGLGVAVAACGIARVFMQSSTARTVLAVIAIAAGVAIVLLPGVMPMCMMDTMRCHAVMAPFARVMGVAAAACAVWGLVPHREG